MSKAPQTSRIGARELVKARDLARGGPLDALRFFAAFFMVIYHYAEQAPVSLFAIHPALGRGYLATDFFLMLSGYVLGRAYGDRVASREVGDREFLLKRFARVWPSHLVMLAGFVALILATTLIGIAPQNPQWFQWSQLPAQALLVQSWGFDGPSGWNTPTWTLSALIFCYAAFPVLWRMFAAIRSPWLAMAVGAAIFVVVDLACRYWLGQASYRLALKYGVIRALPLFLIGVLIARMGREIVVSGRAADLLGAAAIAGVVVLQLVGQFDYASLALLGVLIFAAGASVRKDWGWAKTAGGLAFALYLTNQFVGVVWFGAQNVAAGKLALNDGAMWLTWALAFPAAVVFAAMFERFVDTPLQAWVKPRVGVGTLRSMFRARPSMWRRVVG
ncbi:acyltransferase family protein [Caulobacter sp. DWR1-3-2b1]|uniref:acyltransferase family protein n=1 Tax=Caulobacter sp. DWR1-3-2b1 TaxID=2804670 RepID=UPI003CF7D510